MRVFVAGASGTVGVCVVRELVGRGHDVVAMTRTASKKSSLERLGAAPVVADALDGAAVKAAVQEASPEGVVSLLTALPRNGPRYVRHLAQTNRLREQGTHNLLAAATASGARRYVGESIIFIYGYGQLGPDSVTEKQPPGRERDRALQRAIDALVSCEQQIRHATEADRIEGVSLRFGLYHGAEAPSTQYLFRMVKRRMLPLIAGGRAVHSWIELGDAARAVADALERAPAGAVYNVVDDQPVAFADYAGELARLARAKPPFSVPYALARVVTPYAAMFLAKPRLPVSNARLRRELSWQPQRPTYREALAPLATNDDPTSTPARHG